MATWGNGGHENILSSVGRQGIRHVRYGPGQGTAPSIQRVIASGEQPLIIDCGANIGLSSVWYAREFPAAKIIAVEPDDSNLGMAAKNLSAYPNVILVSGAVWDTPSPLSIVNPEADPWEFRVEEGGGSTAGFTIDQLCEGKPILIVKIDIEGAEKALFQSNTDWMDRTSLIAIELHDWLFPKAGTSRPFMKAIAGRQHEVTIRGENRFFLMMSGHEAPG